MAALEAGLAGWLPRQRWFGGRGERLAAVRVLDRAELAEDGDRLWLLLVEVGDRDGPARRYHLPVLTCPAGHPDAIAPIGESDPEWLRDGLADPAGGRLLLRAITQQRELATRAGGRVRFRAWPAASRLLGQRPSEPIRPLGVEQSNSSVRFGEALLLKCYRRLADGPNPDLEVSRFLREQTDFRQVPELAGTVEYDGPAGQAVSLGLLQELIDLEGDGWSLALVALRRVADDAEAFLTELGAIGRLTARLHLALASGPGDGSFRPVPISPSDVRIWQGAIDGQVERALRELAGRTGPLSERERTAAQAVLAGRARLGARAIGLAGLAAEPALKLRHHGDYHLGQVLKARGADWLVVDFEGEPLRPLAERRARRSPLRDVAGLLRSIDYAARVLAREAPELAHALHAWTDRARGVVLEAYFEAAGRAPFLPARRGVAERAIAAFELEKAAYELSYELVYRPDWIGLPLGFLADLLAEPDPG